MYYISASYGGIRVTKQEEFEKKTAEFLMIENILKFSSSNIKFQDGKIASYWFRAHKKKIETSDNFICKRIMSQYKEYVNLRTNGTLESPWIYSRVKLSLLEEFLEVDDIYKFDYNNETMLSNKVTCGHFFNDNKIYILSKQSECTDKIREQYKKYLFQLKQDEIKRNIRFKHEFSREKSFEKFSDVARLLFSDGRTPMYNWFRSNYDNLKAVAQKNEELGVKPNIEGKIIDQYKKYLLYLEIKKEFLEEENFEKFSEVGNVRFSSGALMSLWWETNMEVILLSNSLDDIKIKNQYHEYLNTINNVAEKVMKKSEKKSS